MNQGHAKIYFNCIGFVCISWSNLQFYYQDSSIVNKHLFLQIILVYKTLRIEAES